MKRNKFLAFLLVVMIIVTLLPAGAVVSLALDYSDTLDLTAARTISSTNGSNVLITMSGEGSPTSNAITVASDFNGCITLQNLNISGGGALITVQANAVVEFILDGANTIASTNNAGISIAAGAEVTITAKTSDDNDSLTVSGGGNGAGIYVGISGSDINEDVVRATLTIGGGTIAASSTLNGGGAAGIGGNGGGNGSMGNINITGGVVTARAGDLTTGGYTGAGIGDGGSQWSGGGPTATSGDITISGGQITAYGGNDLEGRASSGAGIGGGGTSQYDRLLGKIIISGGIVKAYGGSRKDAGNANNAPGAGIGSGGSVRPRNNYNAAIIITGGDITAVGGTDWGDVGAAGIGTGGSTGGNANLPTPIIITDGTVTAIGQHRAAGIGSGGGSVNGGTYTTFADIILTGGTITAKGGEGAANPALKGVAIGAGGSNEFRNLPYKGNIAIGADIKVVDIGARRDIGGNPNDAGTDNFNMKSLVVLPTAKFSYVEYDGVLEEYVPKADNSDGEGAAASTPSFTGVDANKAFWLNPSTPPSTLTSALGIARRLTISANEGTAETFADFSGYDTTVFDTLDITLGGIGAINPIRLGETGGLGNNFVLYLASSMNSANVEFTAYGYDSLLLDAQQMKPAIINVPLIKTGTTPPEPTPEPPSFTLRQFEDDPAERINFYTDTNPHWKDLAGGGIAWRIEGTEETVQHGQFANGDWWVVGPVTVLEITPRATIEEGIAYYQNGNPIDGVLTKHGSMINPMGARGGMTPQGFDSRIYGDAGGYSDVLNAGLYMPLELRPGSSLVSARSFEETEPGPQGNPQVETTAVLTVLAEPAQPGDFRPPYMGNDKSLNWNIADMDYSKLRSLPRIPGNDWAGRPLSPSLDWLTTLFARPKMEYNGTWTGRNTHPHLNHLNAEGGNGIYGREMSNAAGIALLSLNMDYTNQEKEALLINMVQYGIDIYGAAKNGTAWYHDGGHNPGRKMVLMLAAHMLEDDNIMAYSTALTPDGRRYFQEDNVMLYVDQARVDAGKTNEWQYSSGDRPRLQYEESMIGMPEWSGGSSSWNTPYREIAAASSLAHVLAAHLMGLSDEWDSKVLFDYYDRFAEVEISKYSPMANRYGDSMRVLTAHMWQIYRPNISTDSDFTIYDQDMGRITEKAEFSVKYNGSNTAGATLTLIAQKYDADNQPVGAPMEENLLCPIDTAWTVDEIPWRTPGQPHETPYPEPTIQRGPSFTIEMDLPLAEERYEYYLQNEAGTRITPILHKDGITQDTTISIASITPNPTNSSVTVILNNAGQVSGTLIAAVYSGGKLLSLKTKETSENGTIAIDGISIPATADTVRVMFWDITQPMNPLTSSVSVTSW